MIRNYHFHWNLQDTHCSWSLWQQPRSWRSEIFGWCAQSESSKTNYTMWYESNCFIETCRHSTVSISIAIIQVLMESNIWSMHWSAGKWVVMLWFSVWHRLLILRSFARSNVKTWRMSKMTFCLHTKTFLIAVLLFRNKLPPPSNEICWMIECSDLMVTNVRGYFNRIHQTFGDLMRCLTLSSRLVSSQKITAVHEFSYMLVLNKLLMDILCTHT